MSHRPPPPQPARSSRPQTAFGAGPISSNSTDAAPSTVLSRPDTLAAPKPVRPIQQEKLQPPTPQWTATGQPSPPCYTSFPPPPSPAPSAGVVGSPLSSKVQSAGPASPSLSVPGAYVNLRSPGPGALTSFPPPPTPPQAGATSYFPSVVPPRKSTPAPTASRMPPSTAAETTAVYNLLTTAAKTNTGVPATARELRPGVIDFDNLEETLHNLRFAPSPMLSTIYSAPSTPRDELTTPDFSASTASNTSCVTPPSTNPTPEPLTPSSVTPRGPPPAQKGAIISPTRPRANSRRASPPSRKRGRGVVSCINSPVTFTTTWYTHPTAPDFHICSRCYEDHLVGTRFEHDFRPKICDDKKPRVCRFSKPRVKDHLLRNTLITGRIEDLVTFFRQRSTVPDCRGADGVRGSDGPKWYRPKNNAIPNMVVCQACFEDHIQPYRSAANFEPASGQAPNDVWSCDLAIQRIQTVYKAKAAANDWAGFTKEAISRMEMPPCARRQKVHVGSRKWFTPTTNHGSVLVCAACYSDYIANTGEEHKWRDAGDNLASRYGSLVYCVLGHFNVGIAMSRAMETREYSIFWNALDAACSEEFCDPQGIKDGRWYTFPSHPEEFGICASCVATIAEPLGLASSLVPKCGVSPGSTILCSFNPASPRFLSYMTKLLEGFFTADTQPLESYALEYASLPLCPRDEDLQNRRWYGWRDCTICPSCYHEFARGTALAASMPLKGDVISDSLMCEMYSPRMRSLYTEACARSPPNSSELLQVSKARRTVYFETVPVLRQMIIEDELALGRQRKRAVSQIHNVTRQSPDAYTTPGVGLGFSNHFELQGGLYGNQANSILAEYGSGTRSLVFGQLERRWREVE
ncbi:hypothetical protein CCHL11_04503 [Colletotrichum chlorophyti]|uniref:Integral membrane protein n=1 Tax=Colletotrichum chlorophyti TaxID=708187 RepID=A0A1Q8S4G2_9PEZI|nr:hypothetical protein CCHL11_04503 [Colletotrichum chlorophyti]